MSLSDEEYEALETDSLQVHHGEMVHHQGGHAQKGLPRLLSRLDLCDHTQGWPGSGRGLSEKSPGSHENSETGRHLCDGIPQRVSALGQPQTTQ